MPTAAQDICPRWPGRTILPRFCLLLPLCHPNPKYGIVPPISKITWLMQHQFSGRERSWQPQKQEANSWTLNGMEQASALISLDHDQTVLDIAKAYLG